MGSSSPYSAVMKAIYCVLLVFIAFDTFIETDGQVYYIDKDPGKLAILENESCDCNKLLPFDMSAPDANSIKLRDEINNKFENLYEPNLDDNESEDSDENTSTSQPVDSEGRHERQSKIIVTKAKTPSIIWGNMLSIHTVGPLKKFINSNGNTGFEIKEFEMKQINTEKIKTPFNDLINRHKRAVAKYPKRIRISANDVKSPKTSKNKVVKKRSIFDQQLSECPAVQNLRQRKDLNHDMILQYLPEVGSDCPECGTKYVNQHAFGCQCGSCMQCGCSPPVAAVVQHRPQYIEYNHDGAPITYIPGRAEPDNSIVKSPRYVFDQFGHRYLENNGNLRIILPEHIVGAAAPSYPDPEENLYFNKIREVLYGYKDFQNWNSQNQMGELAPPIITQQQGLLQFVRDIVKNRYNEPSKNIPVTVENAFNETNDAALQTNHLFVDEGEGKVEDNVIRIR